MGSSGIRRLKALLEDVHSDLFLVRPRVRRAWAGGDTPRVRGEVVAKLVDAINEVESLAKSSGRRTRKGQGGVSPKVRWYQLMAYLAQILDGVLRNLDLEKYQEKMGELEKAVEELQRTAPQVTG